MKTSDHPILRRLPQNLDQLATETGAIKRRRRVTGGEQLLWLALMFAGLPLSFRTLSAKIQRDYGCQLNDTSIRYRVKNAATFLMEVLNHVLFGAARELQTMGIRRRVCLQDASTVSAPGSKGTDWRLHTEYVLGQGLAQVELTDSSVGESLRHSEYKPGDIVVADQGLGTAANIHHVHNVGAYCLVRVYLKNLRLTDPHGKRLEVSELLDEADRGITSRAACVPLKGHPSVQGRLLISVLPPETAARKRQKLKARASRNGYRTSELALRLAGYFVVFTTAPQEDLSDAQAMELYRLRWQIELFFKRCKSIAGLDQLAAKTPDVARAYILAKLIIMALIDRESIRVEEELRTGTLPIELSTWRVTTLCYDDLMSALREVAARQDRNEIAGLKPLTIGLRKRRTAAIKIYEFNRQLNSMPADRGN
jgi:hypothetical protein